MARQDDLGGIVATTKHIGRGVQHRHTEQHGILMEVRGNKVVVDWFDERLERSEVLMHDLRWA